MNAIAFVGVRFLDIHSHGIFLALEPEIMKEPIPGFVNVVSKEVIETKAGKFDTTKYSMGIADPFIGKLLENYMKNTYIWVDDNSGRVIKIHSSIGEDAYLDVITNHS